MRNQTREEQPERAPGQRLQRAALWLGAAVALLLVSSFVARPAYATPGAGVSQTPIASGGLAAPVRMKLKDGAGFGDGVDVSTIAIVKNIVAPGGYFGWHQHGGPSWIVVTQGTLTFYDADDPTCPGHPVPAGSAFLDVGAHTHNARNETAAPAENYVVRMLPAGAPVRIDISPGPASCHF
jgi:hypothetical protein